MSWWGGDCGRGPLFLLQGVARTQAVTPQNPQEPELGQLGAKALGSRHWPTPWAGVSGGDGWLSLN